jgi:hypothetical protein
MKQTSPGLPRIPTLLDNAEQLRQSMTSSWGRLPRSSRPVPPEVRRAILAQILDDALEICEDNDDSDDSSSSR